MINEVHCFATKFFEIQVPIDNALNVLHEIKRNRETLEVISEATQSKNVSDYVTDYSHGIKLEAFEVIENYIKSLFETQGFLFGITEYWTAIYVTNKGHHSFHNHKLNIFDPCNYSGILYLSNSGGTDFISSSPTSAQNTYHSESCLGKVLLFPSTVPHYYSPRINDDNERYVVAFNCEFYQNVNRCV